MTRRWLICLGLVALTWSVFWQTVDFGFVQIDDPIYVTDNPRVLSGLTVENVSWAFTTTHFLNWIPLTLLSYMLDADIYGTNAGGYHLTNVLWHTANVLLLFVALRELTGSVWRSAFVAALFAVHPLHVESVAWISERKDVLSMFFGLVCLWAYGRYSRQGQAKWYLLALVAFVGSLLSKQTLVTLPFLLLLLDYWPLGRLARASWRRFLLEKIPFFSLTAVFCAVAFYAQREEALAFFGESVPLLVRCANAVVVYVLYIKKTIWPTDLAVFYPHPGESIPAWQVAGAAFLLAAVTVVVIVSAKRRPFLLVGWFWYVGTLVPMIGLVQIGEQRMADRYTYFPLIGLFVMLAWLIPSKLPEQAWRRIALPTALSAALAMLVLTAWQQTAYWSSSTKLFEHALSVTDDNYVAHRNLGIAYHELGRPSQAIEHYQAVLAIGRHPELAHTDLGNVLRDLGQFDDAIGHYRKALEIDATSVDAHYRLSLVLLHLGRVDDGIDHYRQALALLPLKVQRHHAVQYISSHSRLAAILQKNGRLDESRHHLQQVLLIDPQNAEAHNALGEVYMLEENRERALKHFREALLINPDFAQARDNLRIATSSK